MARNPLTLGIPATLAALLFGCATAKAPPPPDAPFGEVWSAESLVGSMWSEICPGGDPEQTWLALYEDNTFAYLYPEANWEYDGDETWRVEGNDLIISWNDGFATTRYRLGASGRLDGTSSKTTCKRIVLEYTGPAPDLEWTEQEVDPTVAP